MNDIEIKSQLRKLKQTTLENAIPNIEELENILVIKITKAFLADYIFEKIGIISILNKKNFRLEFVKTFKREALIEFFGDKSNLDDIDYYNLIGSKLL